jgi:predicted nucleotidyltransferase
MIRDGIKLQDDVLERLPGLIQAIKQRSEVVALYSFGSVVKNDLKPLSDLDYAILLSGQLSKRQRFDEHLELIGIFNNVFRTDEIDLIILNDAPLRFCYVILKTGKLIYFRNKDDLIDLRDQVLKYYLDFKYFRDSFDKVFLEGVGYDG